MDNKSLYEHEIKRLRGIIITLEKLIKELDEDSTLPQSRPFERGDRVKWCKKNYDVSGTQDIHLAEVGLLNERGSILWVPKDEVTLITPAPNREIEVGDTFLCSGRLIHGSGEFTAKQIGDHSVMDTNGHAHALKLCTFRSRPHVTSKSGTDPDVYVEMLPEKVLKLKIKIRSVVKVLGGGTR